MKAAQDGWEELVTTALLGTGRRSLPDGLPDPVGALAGAQHDTGLAVLDAAAGLTAYRRAGSLPSSCPASEIAPRQTLNLAPEPAQQVLDRLLRARDVPMVDVWLRTCVAHDVGVRAGLWFALTVLALARGGPERSLVCAAMGERGRAFVALNPRWRIVLDAARPAPEPDTAWDAATTRAALHQLTSGTLTLPECRQLSVLVGHRGSLSIHHEVQRLAHLESDAGQAWGFGEAARALATRLEIARAFDQAFDQPHVSEQTEQTP